MPIKINFELRNDTKTCYRFEHKNGNDLTTLYLKKTDVDTTGINPKNGITVTIEEKKED